MSPATIGGHALEHVMAGPLLAREEIRMADVKPGTSARASDEGVTIRGAVGLAVRLAVLVVIYAVCFMLSTTVLPPDPNAQLMPDQTSDAGVALVVVAVLNTMVLAYAALRSRWHGLRLAATLALVFYGTYTLLSQIDTLAYPAASSRLPPGMVGALFVSGLIPALAFSPLAVLVLGKWRAAPLSDGPTDGPNARLVMPWKERVERLALIVLLYVLIYYAIGYYVTWRNPAVQAYYGGTDPGSFLDQMGNVVRETPWMLAVQALRGLIFAAISLPVIRMLRGSVWESGLTLGLLLAVLMAAQMLFPNPYMPLEVTRTHLVEIALQNFAFGLVMTTAILWRVQAGPPAATADRG